MDTQEKIIIYQVFTRLFGNNSLRCKPNGSLEENGCGKMADFTTKALNEIKTLGATHIWYTGIIEHATQTNYTRYGIKPDHPAVVKGKAGSPYAIKDYYDVDPDLATSIPDRMVFVTKNGSLKKSKPTALVIKFYNVLASLHW